MVAKSAKIQDTFLLAEKILQKITLKTANKVENHLHGDYKSLFQGHGLDFKEIREYSINDEIKNIDWNVTARTGKPHVRIYEEERDNTVWLLLDISSSMDFGSSFSTKKDVMVKLASLISYMAYKKGDKTGAILFDNGVKEIIRPEKGLKQVYRIIARLLEPNPGEKQNNKNDFAKLTSIIGKKKTLFFLSDFIFQEDEWQKDFGKLAVKNDLTVVQIIDPVEEKIPSVGNLNLYDPESGKTIIFDSSNIELARNYQELLDAENKKINDTFSLLRLNPVKIYTNSDIAEVFISYAQRRRFCTI